jgi:hypothetical protein
MRLALIGTSAAMAITWLLVSFGALMARSLGEADGAPAAPFLIGLAGVALLMLGTVAAGCAAGGSLPYAASAWRGGQPALGVV